MAWTQEKINEIYMKIQRKAVTDEEYREELLKDPGAAIAKVAGGACLLDGCGADACAADGRFAK